MMALIGKLGKSEGSAREFEMDKGVKAGSIPRITIKGT